MTLARTTHSRTAITGMAALAGLLFCTPACRDATEIRLDIRTNLPCTNATQWKGVAVYVGEPGSALEAQSPTLVTTACDGSGHVGSLVIAPSGDKGETIGVRVVAGISRNPEECEEAKYVGCIVARRTVRFTPHGALDLEVALLKDCENQACDPEHTCLTGGCVTSDFVDPSTVMPVGPAVTPSVRCGDDGVLCATSGNVCCLTVDVPNQKARGECRPRAECIEPSFALYCDDDSDCASAEDVAAGNTICRLIYEFHPSALNHWQPTAISQSACLPPPSDIGIQLCEGRSSCGNLECRRSQGYEDRNLLPGYHWCELGGP